MCANFIRGVDKISLFHILIFMGPFGIFTPLEPSSHSFTNTALSHALWWYDMYCIILSSHGLRHSQILIEAASGIEASSWIEHASLTECDSHFEAATHIETSSIFISLKFELNNDIQYRMSWHYNLSLHHFWWGRLIIDEVSTYDEEFNMVLLTELVRKLHILLLLSFIIFSWHFCMKFLLNIPHF